MNKLTVIAKVTVSVDSTIEDGAHVLRIEAREVEALEVRPQLDERQKAARLATFGSGYDAGLIAFDIEVPTP